MNTSPACWPYEQRLQQLLETRTEHREDQGNGPALFRARDASDPGIMWVSATVPVRFRGKERKR